MSDDNNNSVDDYNDTTATPPSPPRKRCHYTQMFRTEWLRNEEFKWWLAKVPNNNKRAKCTLCNVEICCNTFTYKIYVMFLSVEYELKKVD